MNAKGGSSRRDLIQTAHVRLNDSNVNLHIPSALCEAGHFVINRKMNNIPSP